MSNPGTPSAAVRSGQGPDDRADVTSGYNSGGEEDKAGVAAARERRKKEEAAREKLKEVLLRQFEAGQLKAEMSLSSHLASPVSGAEIQKLLREYKAESGRETQPRQIPTIEEQREKMVTTRRIIPPTRQAVPLPDLSRPPPGFLRPPVQAVPMSFYQPQPMYSYEDTIVTRVLQSLMGGRAQQQVELPLCQPQDVVDKVLGWDVVTGSGGKKDKLDGVSRRSIEKSLSKERWRSASRDRERSGERLRRKRRRSLSIESVRRPEARISSKRRSRSRSRHREVKKRFVERKYERERSVERLLRKSNRRRSRERGELSPLTRTCSLRTELSSQGKRRQDSHSAGSSPRIRKIVLLSPKRVQKSVREVIMDERDHKKMRENSHGRSRSPLKKRVKDRLGVRKLDPEEVEVYNMDTLLGRCGAVAVIKEYIDSKNGIMELRTSEGGTGGVILFNAEQVWIPDRKRDPNGPPKPYDVTGSVSVQALFPVGQEVLMNARKVESPIVDLQATAVWPKFTEIPDYKIKMKMMDENLVKFHDGCKIDKLVPICINGLAPVGSLNIWSARVRQIVDKEWGVVEVKSVPRDGKREFSFRFFCFFHKSDVWVEEGVCVGEHKFYQDKALGEIVELLQPVDVVARSIIREKGLAMKKAIGSSVEMQALCVSLRPDCIPDGAPKGTRVDGGPGAFGGSNRGETPYMFKKGLRHDLNVKLSRYMLVSGKICHNLDQSLAVRLEESKKSKSGENVKKVEKEALKSLQNEKTEKKVHRLTETMESKKVLSSLPIVGAVTVDSQNNVVEALHARPAVRLYEKLSNSTARVKEFISESVGLLENLTKDWVCVFQTSDCVLTQGSKPLELYPVGTKVQINANLVNSSHQVQYIASCVWIKSENALILPNNVDKSMIPKVKIILFDEINLKNSHLDLKSGQVVKILDGNFGVIMLDSKMVLFDTCDFWTSQEGTAAQSSKSLPSLVSVGDSVMLHAALVQSSAKIPYLATAVWLANPSPFPADKCPVAIRRDKIHPDKIKIYEMVSRCTALQEEMLPEVVITKTMSSKPIEGTGICKTKVYDQKGVVKIAFKLKGGNGLSAAIMEFTRSSKEKKQYAFYLASSSVESHEKTKICIPETKVYFSAVPVGKDFPVSHIATAVSHIHCKMPLNNDVDKIVETAKEALNKIMNEKTEFDDLKSGKSRIISMGGPIHSTSKVKDPSVSDCFPTGRLVCMFDEKAGIMEDHRRELAYFEKADLNLPAGLEMKDIVVVMTRCRDVTIRFQATHVLDGPVKMIVHDGTVSISSNLERYYPEILVKKNKISMKPNSFKPEKVTRAKAAVELYKVDKFLTPDYIIDSGEFNSTLVKPKKHTSSTISISSSIKPIVIKSAALLSSNDVKCLTKQTGKVMTILNDSFGLLKFLQDGSKSSYCLFDTFDLYLEGGRTAAQSKLTVANVLDLGMSVSFHACEILSGSPVSWLATGVWRPEKATQPKPVAYNKITKEKVGVFKKVAETCAVLVSDELAAAEVQEVSTGNISGLLDISEVDNYNISTEEGMVVNETEVVSKDDSEQGPLVLAQREKNETVQYGEAIEESIADKKSCQFKKENLETVERSKSCNQVPLKPEVVGVVSKEVVSDVIVKEEMLETSDIKNEVSIDLNVAGAINKLSSHECPPMTSVSESDLMPSSPVLFLPEFLTDQSTSGTLAIQLSDVLAIFSLDCPAGTKALLHRDRLWVADNAMLERSGWEMLSGKVVRINARRVEGYEEFEYQVTFGHLDPGVLSKEMVECTYPDELAKFAEDKLELEMLEKELLLFKEKK